MSRPLIIAGTAFGLVFLIWFVYFIFGSGDSAVNGRPAKKQSGQTTEVCPRVQQIQNGIGKMCVYNCSGELYRMDVIIRGCPERLEF